MTMKSPTADVSDLEGRIRFEFEACTAALRSALTHAANVGATVDEVFARLTQTSWQRWCDGDGNPVGRHLAMVCRRIGKSDLENKLLAEIILTRTAEFLATHKETPKATGKAHPIRSAPFAPCIDPIAAQLLKAEFRQRHCAICSGEPDGPT